MLPRTEITRIIDEKWVKTNRRLNLRIDVLQISKWIDTNRHLSVDVILWALVIEISFANKFSNNWLKNTLFYRVIAEDCFDMFCDRQICLFLCIFGFLLKKIKIFILHIFYKLHSKSTSGSCESQFTFFISYNHHGPRTSC